MRKIKAYIAGKLGNEEEIETLEKIDAVCKSLGIDTFLPHRNVGILKDISDTKKIFEGDIIKGFQNVNLVVANLNGLSVGAGTAWELGYAYAKNIPLIGVKTDESVEEALDNLSAILIESVEILNSFDKLKERLKKFINQASL